PDRADDAERERPTLRRRRRAGFRWETSHARPHEAPVLAGPGPRRSEREPARAGSRGLGGYGRSWAVPKSETAPGPGRSPAESTVALKVGWMQKMLTSVEGCPIPSVRSPAAGEPV